MTFPVDSLDSIARVSVMLGLTLLALPLLKNRSAVARRLVLSVAFASVLIIPFLPAWHVVDAAPTYRHLVARVVAEPIATTTLSGADTTTITSSSSSSSSSINWLLLTWFMGAFAIAARYVIGVIHARRIVARASNGSSTFESAIARAEQKTGLRAVVRVSSEVEVPAVTGILSPVVILPTSALSWSEERKVSVLLHELAHVVAHDLSVQLLVTIACSLHWFNPLVWLAARRLRLERELAADEAVLRADMGIRASSYAADLLAIAGRAPAGTIAIGEKPLPKRIAAIVAVKRPSILDWKSAVALVFGTLAIALGVACTTTTTTTTTATTATESPTTPPSHAAVVVVPNDLQAMADRELDRTVKEWKATGGTILVMSPKGEVLADAGGHADQTYVPGSTMKAILLAAALDEGVVNEKDVFDCSRGERRNGKILHDASPGKQNVALQDVLARSSNVGFAQIFDRVGGAHYDRVLRQFHFAPPPDLASAPSGDWNGALTAIGINMNATPRQVTLAYATLANGGDGIVKQSTAERVSTLLEGVVASERGTGKKARVAGVRVAGKTGSSDWTSPDGNKVTYASFVGYVPADHPRYVIFVGVESPSGNEAWGGEVASPVFSRVATQLLNRTTAK